jgi:capsular polysaccharide biosynthesis protein
MQTKLKKMMKVTPDRQTSFVSISLDADTPQMAQMLLGVVYKEADNVLRRSQQEYSSNRIAYLTKELDRTTLADQRQAIIAILSVQEQRLMMASADRNVAIDVIDEPYAPLLPSSPQPRVVLATYAFFAGVLGMLMALLHGLRQRQRHGTSVTIDQRLFGWVRRKR